MKFKLAPDKATIEWIDGAEIYVERLTDEEKSVIRKDCAKRGISDIETLSDIFFENMIKGWNKIINDATEKPLEFNNAIRKQIFEALKGDGEFGDKFLTFVRGPLGNLKAGSTSISTTDGTTENAASASEKTEKITSPASGESVNL